jgi:DNA mismatch repair protein MutS
VIQRAAEILEVLEGQHNVWAAGEAFSSTPKPGKGGQLSFMTDGPNPVIEELRSLNIEAMSPIDAITRLYELQRKAKAGE